MGLLSYNHVAEKIRRSIVSLTILVSIVATAIATASQQQQNLYPSASSDTIQQLPFCGDGDQRTISRRLLYVTTLDGKLTALDLKKNGTKYWSIKTDPGSLISSSIHRLELTNNGQWVRMIPSLNGVLYKFDGETIDPVPITVDNLLSSSYKFSDDLVISGGKETRSYGMSVRTGQLLYECSMKGCINSTTDSISSSSSSSKINLNENDKNDKQSEHDPLIDDIIVIRRQTQTVRAIEPRSGTERWNFSVGHHELDLLQSSECHDKLRTTDEIDILEIDIKVIVPEGIIGAFNRNNPKEILWKYKFDHPIVSVWRVDQNDEIKNIDLFNSAQWILNDNVKNEGWVSPSLYVGMFQKQLYIQESSDLLNALFAKSQNLEYNLLNDELNVFSIPWKPLLATTSGSSLAVSSSHNSDILVHSNDKDEKIIKSDEITSLSNTEDNTAVTALSVLYASEYVNGNGFFLFTTGDLNKTNSGSCNSEKNSTITTTKSDNETSEELNFEFIDDIIVLLWVWWKEIIVISLTSAIVLKLFLSPRFILREEVVMIPIPTAVEATEELVTKISRNSRSSQRSLSESHSHDSNDHFISRFLTDFDLIQCLGKGGFGVVFEAKNKLDDCNYAVKRITLPNKKESRDRVMREVKTLANCEHKNIVRYFHAWIENPPPGWQEQEDKKLLQRDLISTSIDIETPDDGTTLPPFPSNDCRNSINHLNKAIMTNRNLNDSSSIISNFNNTKFVNDYLKKGCEKTTKSFNDDDSCSFIEFKAASDDSNNNNNHNGCSNNKNNGYEEDSSDDNDDCNKSKTSGNNERSIKIDINSVVDRNCGPPRIELDDDDDDSFEIEFKTPSNDGNFNLDKNSNSIEKSIISIPSEIQSISKNPNFKLTRHKRPMSLDLSSKGNVIVPIDLSPLQQNQEEHQKQQQQQQQQQQKTKIYLYIQMQLCQKESLKEWLRDTKIPVRIPRIPEIFEQIIDAVIYVHHKGLIHRDLKPSNIFFSLDGQIKIGDFGLVTDMPTSSSSSSSSSLSFSSLSSSSSSSVFYDENHKNGTKIPYNNNNNNNINVNRYTQQVGTHLYMSPEQLNGHSYDSSVDIYSLGLIFFELLVYFSTEMERIKTLKGVRDGRFPNEFDRMFPNEHKLLSLMLSNKPAERPHALEVKRMFFDMKSSITSSSKN